MIQGLISPRGKAYATSEVIQFIDIALSSSTKLNDRVRQREGGANQNDRIVHYYSDVGPRKTGGLKTNAPNRSEISPAIKKE